MSVWVEKSKEKEIAQKVAIDEDDWDTDTDYVNDVSEKDQRWGSKIINPDKNHFSIHELRDEVIQKHEEKALAAENKHTSQVHNYGGK